MPRYILIDNHSGYIFGDTADLPKHTFAGDDFPVNQGGVSPEDAARWLDETEVREFGRTYERKSRPDASNECGYLVYRADVGGSEKIGNITDGQDPEMIAAVERDCEYVCFVAASQPSDL